jgi:hypothetical protein
VVRLLIDNSNHLDVLGAISPLSRLNDWNLPSWTPDWTVIGSDLALLSDKYRAAGDTYPILEEHENPRILALSGCIVDEAGKLGERLPYGLIDGITPEDVFRECISLFGEEEGNLDNTEFFHTQAVAMVGGRGPNGEFPMTDSQRRRRVTEYMAWIHTMYSNQLRTEVGEDRVAAASRIDTSNYRHWFDVAFLLNRPLVTSGGRFGIAPMPAEPGDKVCILLGGHMPFVMRQEGDEWLLVGTAYVHGLMNGEAMERGDIEIRDFHVH